MGGYEWFKCGSVEVIFYLVIVSDKLGSHQRGGLIWTESWPSSSLNHLAIQNVELNIKSNLLEHCLWLARNFQAYNMFH